MPPERELDERAGTNSINESESAETNADDPMKERRRLGWARGELKVPDDFDTPLPADIEDSFYK